MIDNYSLFLSVADTSNCESLTCKMCHCVATNDHASEG